MIETIFRIICCHMVGDYVLQSDFIARTKGENWYHLFVHSILYTLPFYLCFGIDSRLLIIFLSHFVVDLGKARYKKFSYVEDQFWHYCYAFVYLMQ